MSLVWERNGETFYASVNALDGTVRYWLTAEPIPDGKWDWVVLSPDGKFEAQGVALTFHAAMSNAELCVPPLI
jgi:hypothetical protein